MPRGCSGGRDSRPLAVWRRRAAERAVWGEVAEQLKSARPSRRLRGKLYCELHD